MYKLVSENLTCEGPSIIRFPCINWEKYFNKLENAKEAARENYAEELGEGVAYIPWIKTEYGYKTEDLSFVIYHICEIETED